MAKMQHVLAYQETSSAVGWTAGSREGRAIICMANITKGSEEIDIGRRHEALLSGNRSGLYKKWCVH